MPDYNVEERVQTLVTAAQAFANFTRGNDVMLLFG